MTHARRLRALLAVLFAVALVTVLGGAGCANGGGDNATGGGDDGSSDVTLEGGEGGGEASGCTGGKTLCGATCTNTGNDPKNCGMCGHACPMGQVCSMGMCGYSCSAGETLCGATDGGTSTPDASGSADTGAMDASAEAGTDASDEGGSVVDSGGGAMDAAGPMGPYCANTNNDPSNCGGCGNACGAGQTCVNGSCACGSGQKVCIASGTCIPENSCCNSGDCSMSGEICPMPGGTCSCPGGERECMKTMSCISSNDCCVDSDCSGVITGGTCPTAGQACQCSNGDKLCLALKICVASTDCCTPSDCSAPNAQTYTCGTTSTMAGTCGIATCKAGCADINKVYTDGCECCDDTTAGKSCSAATPLGTNPLVVGAAPATATGVLPTNDGDWYAVTFASENNIAFHALVQLTTGSSEYVFDVIQGGCGGTPINCNDGNSSTGRVTWETSYSGPNPPADPGSPGFQPIPALGTLYIHVYRANPATMTCNPYTLSVQE